jgi:hypothetical protein
LRRGRRRHADHDNDYDDDGCDDGRAGGGGVAMSLFPCLCLINIATRGKFTQQRKVITGVENLQNGNTRCACVWTERQRQSARNRHLNYYDTSHTERVN